MERGSAAGMHFPTFPRVSTEYKRSAPIRLATAAAMCGPAAHTPARAAF